MSILVPVIIVGFIALVAAAIYAAHVAEKKRTEGFQNAANELGFEFLPMGEANFLERLSNFHLFSQGHSKRMWNLLRGTTQDLEVAIFDYRYVVGSGKHSHTFNHTVICFQFEGTALPDFTVRPENFSHKIGAWFGYRDINFDDDKVFSSMYQLRGGDESAVRALFTETVRSFYREKHGVSTEGAGNRLVFYRHAARVKPENLRSFMEEGFGVLTQFHSMG